MDYIVSFTLFAIYLLIEKIIIKKIKFIKIFYLLTFILGVIGILFFKNIYLEKFYFLIAIFSVKDYIKIYRNNKEL